MKLSRSPFLVDDTAFCVCDVDMERKSKQFLKAIDADYFRYIAEIHSENLNDEKDRIRASMVLRTTYYQALETFFSLVGALLQAHKCEYAFIMKANTFNLKKLIGKINESPEKIQHIYLSDDVITWWRISEIVYDGIVTDNKLTFVEGYARSWKKFSFDFLDDNHRNEFNSLKHGFRVSSGGFKMLFGPEVKPSIECKPKDMKLIGESDFGSTFFVANNLQESESIRNDPYFCTKMHSLNWSAENTANALNLLYMSIKNIKAHLLYRNGEPAENLDFIGFKDENDFNAPWESNVGLVSSNMDFPVYEKDIVRLTQKELKKQIIANKTKARKPR